MYHRTLRTDNISEIRVLHGIGRNFCHIPCRSVMPLGRQPVGVAEMRLPAAQLFRFRVHTVGKLQDISGNILRYYHSSAVIRLHHHAPHQLAGAHLLPALHTQVRVFRSGSGHADIKNGIQSFFFQAQDTGHHLGQAGGRTAGIRILFINHTTGPGVNQDCRLRLHVGRGPHLRAVHGNKSSSKQQISE